MRKLKALGRRKLNRPKKTITSAVIYAIELMEQRILLSTVAYWRLDAGTPGSTIAAPVLDESGTKPLSVQGSPQYSSDTAFTVVPQTGQSDAVSARFFGNGGLTSTNPALNSFSSQQWTIEATVKFNSTGQSTFLGKDGPGTQPADLWFQTDQGHGGCFTAYINDIAGQSGLVVGSTIPVVGRWYHVALTSDGTTARLYVNGQFDGSVALSTGGEIRSTPWTIGRGYFGGGSADFVDGWVDEVRITDEAIAPSRFLNAANGVNVAAGKSVSLVAGSIAGGDMATLVDGVLRPRGTGYNDGTVFWSDPQTTLAISLNSPKVISGVSLQADINDVYQFDYHNPDTNQWLPMWTAPDLSGVIPFGMISRPDFPTTTVNDYLMLPSPVTADSVRVHATSGDGAYSVSEIRLLSPQDLPNAGDTVAINFGTYPDSGLTVPPDAIIGNEWQSRGVIFSARDGVGSSTIQPLSYGSGPGPNGRGIFFTSDIFGAIAVFNFVDPGTFTPADIDYFKVNIGFDNASEQCDVVALDENGQVVQMISRTGFNSPTTVEMNSRARRIEVRTRGNPGIGIGDVAFRLAGTAVDIDLQPASDTGVSATDNITSVAKPTFDVTVDGAGAINVDFNGDNIVDVVQNVPAGGKYVFAPPSSLADGSYTAKTTFTPTGGTAASATVTYTIDTHGPKVFDHDPAKALAFNGGDQFLSIPTSPSLRPTAAMTIEAWIQPTAASLTGGHGIAGSWNDLSGANERSFNISLFDGKPLFNISNTGTDYNLQITGPATLTAGQWYHLAGTYDGSAIRLFVNGTQVAQMNASGNIATNNWPFYIGRVDGAGGQQPIYFTGDIDDVRLWNIARTPLQIASSITGNDVTPGGGLVGRWKLDEGANTTANDSSGTGNTGTLAGSTPGSLPSWIDSTTPVRAVTPTGVVEQPVSSFLLNFDGPIDPATLLTGVSLKTPGNTTISPTSYIQQTSTAYYVNFPVQSVSGSYTLLVGPDVDDIAGNLMDQDNDGTNGEPLQDVFTTKLSVEAADLVVTSLNITPNNPQSGQTLSISWSDTNSGNKMTSGSWLDRIQIVNTTTNQTLFDSTMPYDPAAPGNGDVAVGDSRVRNFSFALPQGPAGVGNIQVIVTADSANSIVETNSNGTGETNNSSVKNVTSTLAPAPDLSVSNVVGPIDAFSGGQINVTWTITNTGSADAIGTWSDNVYLATDAGGSSRQPAGSFLFTGVIAAGQSITRVQSISLPFNLSGDRYIVVVSNDNNDPFELNKVNNTAVSASPVHVTLAPQPNLVVSSVVAPPTAFSGQQTQIQWIVSNTGTGGTSSPLWSDSVFLSPKQSFDDTAVFLGSTTNASYLSAGDSYTNSLTVKLPKAIQGNFYFLVQADSSNKVGEPGNENDNFSVGEVTAVQLTPPPDLQVTSVVAPTQAFSGNSISLKWTILNAGQGPSVEGTWFDQVYMSLKPTFEATAIPLDTIEHNGNVAPNGTYTTIRSVKLPIGISGDYYFYVVADANNNVFEGVFEGNNASEPSGLTTINLTPPPDLTLNGVNVQSTVLAGHQLTISAIGSRNAGAGSTSNPNWADAFYLSPTNTLDVATAIHLGDIPHYGGLSAGANYSSTGTFTVPYGIDGTYFAFVVLDTSKEVFELDRSNNIAGSANTLTITTQNAKITVPTINAPTNAMAGEPITVAWTVANIGSGDSIINAWNDVVLLDLGNNTTTALAWFNHYGVLGAGGSYSASKTFNLPISLNGSYKLYVVSDSDNTIHEDGGPRSNLSTAHSINISRQTADLTVTQVTSPGTGMAGQPLSISWTVQNIGSAATNNGYWYDEVFLSTTSDLNSGAHTSLGSFRHTNGIDPGEQYTVNQNIVIPNSVSGKMYVIVRTNKSDEVYEVNKSNNDRAAALVTDIAPNPPVIADLVLASIVTPSNAYSGQSLDISWTVRNDGDSIIPALNNQWYDAIYLSRDQVFDRTLDTPLGFEYHVSGLGSGQTYTTTKSFQIPAGFSGPFYLFVIADSGGNLNENGKIANNLKLSSVIDVTLAPPADLIAGDIVVPSNGVPGEVASITYTILNNGVNPAVGSWTDSLYVSIDDTWDINDPLLGRVDHSGSVPGNGGSYSNTLIAPLPALSPGTYKLIVRTDIRNNISESQENNNIGASLDSVYIDVPQLQLDVPASGTLSQGQAIYYRVDVSAGETLLINLDSTSSTASNELFVRLGQLPTRTQFDVGYSSPLKPDQRVLVPTTQAGTYYIMLYGDSVIGSPSFTIGAKTVQFSILDTHYGKAGTAGNRTIQINGARFDSSVTATLVGSDGSPIVSAVAYYRVDATRLYATFDLSSVAPGMYGVMLKNGSALTTTLQDSLQVVAGGGSHLTVSPQVPNNVLRPQHDPPSRFSFIVGWSNDGLNDVIAPLIQVNSSTAISRDPEHIFGLSVPEPGPFGVFNHYTGGTFTFYAASTGDGPAGILMPGQGGSILAFGLIDANPADIQTWTNTLGIDQLDSPYPWTDIEEQLRPSDMAASQFQPLFEELVTQIGPTWKDVLATLSRDATLLPIGAGDPTDPIQLLKLNLNSVIAANGTSLRGAIIASALDVHIANLQVIATNTLTNEFFVTHTLNDGFFLFPSVTPGSYSIAANGARVLLVSPNPIIVDPGMAFSGVQLAVDRGLILSGTVVSEQNNLPIPAATVSLVGNDGLLTTITTDISGRYFSVGLKPGTYSVLVEADGWARTAIAHYELNSPSQVLNLAIDLSSRIFGKWSTGNEEQAVSTIGVIATPLNGTDKTLYYGTLIDDTFAISNLVGGHYRITITAPGFQDVTFADVSVPAHGEVNIGNAVLIPAATIYGHVDAGSTGATVAGTIVIATESSGASYTGGVKSDGTYVIAGLAPGQYSIHVTDSSAHISDSMQVGLALGQTVTDINLSLHDGATIFGTVKDLNDNALAGVAVSAIQSNGTIHNAITASDGTYTIFGIGIGLTKVMALGGGPNAIASVNVAVLDGTNYSANLQVASIARISGTVKLSDGSPDAEANVTISNGDFVIASATSDASGHYSIYMRATGNYFLAIASSDASYITKQNLSISSGDNLMEDFNAGSGSLIAAISGLQNAGTATVQLYRLEDSQRVLAGFASVASSSSITFNHLISGDYIVTARADGQIAQQAIAIVDGTSTSISVAWVQAASLTGSIKTNTGLPIPSASIRLYAEDLSGASASGASSPDGFYGLTNLVAGDYTIVVSAPGFEPKISSHVAVSTDSFLEMMLVQSNTSLAGQVEEPSGAKVPFAAIAVLDETGHTLSVVTSDIDGAFVIDVTAGEIVSLVVKGSGTSATIISRISASAGLNQIGIITVQPIALGGAGNTLSSQLNVRATSNNLLSVAPSGIFDTIGRWFDKFLDTISKYALQSRDHVGSIPGQAGDPCCEAALAALRRAKKTQDDAFQKLQDQYRIVVGTSLSLEAIITNRAAVAVNTVLGLAVSVEAAYALLTTGAIAGVELTAGFAFANAVTGFLNALNDLTLKIGEIPRASEINGVLGSAATSQGVINSILSLQKSIYDLALSATKYFKPGTPFTTPGPGSAAVDSFLGILNYTTYVLNGSVQKALTDIQEAASQLIQEQSTLNSLGVRYDVAAFNAHDALEAYNKCEEDPPCDKQPSDDKDEHKDTHKKGVYDPNDIIGPLGFGAEGWVSVHQSFTYLIHFENDPTLANAPVQHVRITQDLDSSLDLQTFRLGTFGFGTVTVTVPDNRSFFQTRLDLTSTLGILVDVTGGVDVLKGRAFWDLQAIDPATGEQPIDPTVGLLPPNADGVSGQGFVSYTIQPKSTAITGTIVQAQARIFFDHNEPIDTPSIQNTIDAGNPTSSVETLADISSASFVVKWSGQDDPNGSALAEFTIYVSEDDGPYTLWLSDTTLTQATFSGKAGRRYAFYSIAKDNAGNIEADPPTPDAVTTVSANATGSISGRVFNDTNSNGVHDDGENSKNGWTVYLDANNDGVFDAGEPFAVTDVNGEFNFIGLTDGTYFLKQVIQSSYRKTLPGRGVFGYAVDVSGGSAVVGKDFGITTNVYLAGIVYNDSNGNGKQDWGELGLSNVIVNIVSNDVILATRTTDALGFWQVQGLSAGSGEADVIFPEGYTATAPIGGKYIGSMSSGERNGNLNFGLKQFSPVPATSAKFRNQPSVLMRSTSRSLAQAISRPTDGTTSIFEHRHVSLNFFNTGENEVEW